MINVQTKSMCFSALHRSRKQYKINLSSLSINLFTEKQCFQHYENSKADVLQEQTVVPVCLITTE